jgi:hypothetical protein
MFVIDVLYAGAVTELGSRQQPSQSPILPIADFAIYQQSESFIKAQSISGRLFQLLLIGFSHPSEVEAT